jgi:hypothetical protein
MNWRFLSVVVAVFLLVGPVCGNSTTTTAPTTEPQAYSLEDSNNKRLPHATGDEIKAAVTALDGDKVVFLTLRADAGHFLQVNWDAANSFSFQYQAGDEKHLFQSTRKYTAAVAEKLLLAYQSGADNWAKQIEWEPVK